MRLWPATRAGCYRLGMSPLALIAEDDKDIADILRAYLEREGFRTVQAADGRTALDVHLALRPDIILLDITMPLVDGWEVLSKVRRRGGTPIIVITALDQDLDKLQALRIGADAMAARLQRMADDVSVWNAQIAHELRTPLTILQGRLQGAKDGVSHSTHP